MVRRAFVCLVLLALVPLPARAAVVREQVVSGGGTGISTTLPSISGGIDQTYVLFAATKKSKDVSAVSGGGLFWTERVVQCSEDKKVGLRLFTAQGSPASAFSIQITLAGAEKLAAVLARYSGVVAFENPRGENANGPGGDCSKGDKEDSATLTLTSSVAGAVHVVGVGLEKKSVSSPSAGYATVGTHQQDKARAFVYDAGFTSPTTDTFQASLSGKDHWATAGIVLAPTAPAPPAPGSRVYWTDEGTKKVQRANLDGTAVSDIATGLGKPKDVAIDATGGKVYWIDDGAKKIARANLDGSAVQDVVTGLGKPKALAVDGASGRIYWSDETGKKIRVANLDGSAAADLVTNIEKSEGMAVDPTGGKLYWTNEKKKKVQRANLDGTNVEDIVTGVGKVKGLALDLEAGKVYWVEEDNKRIRRANLDGTNVEDVVSGLGKPKDVAVDGGGGRLYWTDDGGKRIQTANLDGSGIQDIVTGLSKPRGIALELGTGLGAVDGFVITHDGAGVHCLAEPVAVTARDSAGSTLTDYGGSVTLDTQTGTGDWMNGPGNSGSFMDATPGDGLASYTFDAADSGSASFFLDYPSGADTLDIDVFETANTALRDDDSEGSIVFAPSGFVLTANVLANPPPNPISDPVGPETAGSSFPIHLTAYGQTATDPVCGVIESYTGGRSLTFWSAYQDPASGTLAVTVDGVVIAGSEAAALPQPVTFSSGQAQVLAKYKDVGRIRISVVDDTVAEPAAGVRGATNPFVVKPASFVISGVTRPDGSPNPGASTPSGAVFVAAGAPFHATVQVRDAEGSLTPNYGSESVPEGIRLSAAQLLAPLGGRNGTANDGSIGSGTAFAAGLPAGTFSGTSFSWDEVGAITLRASVADGDYLGAGDVLGPETGSVGRFTPSQFAVVANAPVFQTGCALGGFSYVGQPVAFVSGSEPVLSVTAQNAAGGTTQNYAGPWWKITNNTLSGRSYTSAGGTLDESGLPPESTDPVIAEAGNGTGSLTFGTGTGLAFTRGAPVPPVEAEIALSISVTDGDGVSFPGNPATIGTAAPGGGIAFDSGKTFLFGRLAIENAHDSELLPLAVPLRAQFFDGTAFVPNTDDSCTAVALGDLLLSATPAGLPSTPNLTNIPLLLGDAGLVFSPPGEGNAGWLDVEIDLSTSSGADLPWLQYDWPGDGNLDGVLDDNPRARATFGIFRGRDEIIYVREVY